VWSLIDSLLAAYWLTGLLAYSMGKCGRIIAAGKSTVHDSTEEKASALHTGSEWGKAEKYFYFVQEKYLYIS